MNCVKCSKEIPDGSGFCNLCGSPQTPAPGAAPPSPPAPDTKPTLAPPAPEKEVPEEILWKGRFSGKALAHYWILYLVYLGVLGYVTWLLHSTWPEATWLMWTMVVILALPAPVIGAKIFYNKMTIRYRLTNQRLFVERGLVSRDLRELELIRVDDVSVKQNLLQRIFNVGVVQVISTDATDPRLDIAGIDNPIEVKEKIRTCVRQRRAKSLHMESL